VKSLRNTHFYGKAFLHYPLEIKLQRIYPKERLAISWQSLGDGNEAGILEKISWMNMPRNGVMNMALLTIRSGHRICAANLSVTIKNLRA
jgi:hypothetical protein